MYSVATLSFDWVTASLRAIVAFELGRVEQARVRCLAREIVAICRVQRDRVVRADRLLEEHRDLLSIEQRNEVLRLMAEVLLYIQFRGVRIKVTADPRRVLEGA
jgi:hypothetical protein